MRRKLRMGMIGGGQGAFIGNIHRIAARLDGHIELVCGAFSSNPKTSLDSGREYYLPDDRIYGSYEEMISAERNLPNDLRMDFVSIVTPNHLHFGPAKMALENGFHVICDKPLCNDLDEAYELKKLVDSSGLIFAITHTYSGYPMVKQARNMLLDEVFGKIRRIEATYPQGWLSTFLEKENNKQANWRTDPKKAGKAGSIGDIGTHAENLIEYVTSLNIKELSADLHTHVEGRLLEDDASILLRFDQGARGILTASQISAGEENDLTLKVYGEKGGLEWKQLSPNTLLIKWLDQPTQVYRSGVGDLYPQTLLHMRTPAGHPEGYLEAFANIYRNFSFALQAKLNDEKIDPLFDFPTIDDGIRGMIFIEKVVESGNSKEKWTSMNTDK